MNADCLRRGKLCKILRTVIHIKYEYAVISCSEMKWGCLNRHGTYEFPALHSVVLFYCLKVIKLKNSVNFKILEEPKFVNLHAW